MIAAIRRYLPTWDDIGNALLFTMVGAGITIFVPTAIFAIGYLFGLGFHAAAN